MKTFDKTLPLEWRPADERAQGRPLPPSDIHKRRTTPKMYQAVPTDNAPTPKLAEVKPHPNTAATPPPPPPPPRASGRSGEWSALYAHNRQQWRVSQPPNPAAPGVHGGAIPSGPMTEGPPVSQRQPSHAPPPSIRGPQYAPHAFPGAGLEGIPSSSQRFIETEPDLSMGRPHTQAQEQLQAGGVGAFPISSEPTPLDPNVKCDKTLPSEPPAWIRTAVELRALLDEAIKTRTVDPEKQLAVERAHAAWTMGSYSPRQIYRVSRLVDQTLRVMSTSMPRDRSAKAYECAVLVYNGLPTRVREWMSRDRVVIILQALAEDPNTRRGRVRATAELLGWHEQAYDAVEAMISLAQSRMSEERESSKRGNRR